MLTGGEELVEWIIASSPLNASSSYVIMLIRSNDRGSNTYYWGKEETMAFVGHAYAPHPFSSKNQTPALYVQGLVFDIFHIDIDMKK